MKKVILDVKVMFQMTKLAWQAHPFYFCTILLIEVVQGILPILQAWYMKVLVDKLVLVIQDRKNNFSPELVFILIFQVVFYVIGSLLPPIVGYMSSEIGRRLQINTQIITSNKINSLMGLAPFEDPELFNLIQLGTRGAQTGSQSINLSMSFVRNILTISSFTTILVIFSPMLALIVGVAILPQLYVQMRLSKQNFDLYVRNSTKERIAGYYNSILTSNVFAKEVRLFGLADHFLKPFTRLSEEIHSSHRKQHQRELCWRIALDTITGVVGAIAFVLIALQVFSGNLTVGDVTLYMSAVASLQGASLSIIFNIVSLREQILYYNQFIKLLNLPQTLFVAPSPIPVPPLTIGIEFRNVSFRYSRRHPWVLRDVNFTIPAKKCVALVGLNGSGKTTLVKLLARLYDPTDGCILWDGTDIRSFEPQEFRRRVGAIFQDFARYELGAYENIAVGDVVRFNDVDRVRKAAERAGIHSTLEGLSQGYGTTLSRSLSFDEDGVDLSLGQWQKIALARMFVREADVQILDEPTASLDAQSEYNLYQYFMNLVEEKTTLLISHRFSTVRIADFIAVMENGCITEYGSHADLIVKNGAYARLYNLQAQQYKGI
jgi:ATP-binding cassette subfamily B protein